MTGTRNIQFVDFIGQNLANAGIPCALAYNPSLDKAGIKMENTIENNTRLQVEIENAVRCTDTKTIQRALVNFHKKTFNSN